jgi:hypothetical protein
VVFLKPRPFVKRSNEESELHLVSLLYLCVVPTFHCLTLYYLPSPPATVLSSLCLQKSPESLPGESCLGSPGVGCFSGNYSTSELNSSGFWTYKIRELATTCRKFWYTGCIKMIGVVWKLIIFTSMVKRLINSSRNERVTLQVYDTCLQMFLFFGLCKEKTVSLVPRFLLTYTAVLHFLLYKGTPLSETADTIV